MHHILSASLRDAMSHRTPEPGVETPGYHHASQGEAKDAAERQAKVARPFKAGTEGCIIIPPSRRDG